MTFILDVSQLDEPGLPAEISLPGFDSIILIARSDQKAKSSSFSPNVSWILVDGGHSQSQRFSLAAHYITSEWLVYHHGSWPHSVDVLADLNQSMALLGGEHAAYRDSALLSLTNAFVMQTKAYCVLRGLNPAIQDFQSAVADFGLRCQLMGWIADSERAGVRLDGATFSPTAEAAEQDQYRRPVPGRIGLIANLPRWPHKPYGAAPLVSVVIATYNRAEFIEEAINSVRLQTFQDFEIIVVDDGGTDNTEEIVTSIDDPRIRYFWRERGGIATARNYAADVSRGYFTAVHDSDDIMLPNRLELGLKALHNHFTASYGAWVNFNEGTTDMIMHVTKENFNLDVLAVTGQATGHPTWLVPTWIIRQLKYDTRLSSAVDHNLATRTALLGLGWTHVGKAVVLRRIHDGQVSNVDSKNQKLGAWLTRQFAVSGLRADIEYSARERVKEHHPWVQVKERADLARAFTKYLPGQNWLKAIVISGPLASKLGILTNYEEAVTLGAELDSDGKVVRERAWLYEPDIQSLAALVAHGYTFEAVIADSQEALSHAAEKWVTRSLTGAHRSMDTSVVLVGKVDRCPDLSDLGGSAFYLRDLEGRETWTVAIPVQDSEQINQAIRDFGIAVPAVMASKSVEMTELMAMIGAELE